MNKLLRLLIALFAVAQFTARSADQFTLAVTSTGKIKDAGFVAVNAFVTNSTGATNLTAALTGVSNALAGITSTLAGGSTVTTSVLLAWTTSGAYEITSATYDSDGCVTVATAKWPDGSSGTFTRTAKDPVWLVVNAFTITHTLSGKTITQAAVTRDSALGVVTSKPALTVL